MKYRNFTRLGADYPNEKAIPDYLQVKPRLLNYFEFLLLATSIFTTIGGIISAVLHEISITLSLFSGFNPLGLAGAFVLSQDSIHHRTAIFFKYIVCKRYLYSCSFRSGYKIIPRRGDSAYYNLAMFLEAKSVILCIVPQKNLTKRSMVPAAGWL